ATSLYGGEDNVTRDFDHLNRLHSDPQQPRGEGRITDEIERWIAKGVKPDVLVIGAGRGLVPVRLLQRYQDQIQVHAINGPELFSEDLLHSPQTLAYQLRNENLSEAQAEELILKIRERYEIADVNQSFGKFENQKFHIIVVAQATMQYLDKISVLERMRKHLVKDGVYITDLDIFSVHDGNDNKKLNVKSFFESLSPQYKIFGANFGDAGVMPPEIYASLLYRNTDPDASTSIPLQASSGNSVFITTPGARLASDEEENIVTIEPENQLVDSVKVRALMESLNVSRNKKAVFIGPGNPNLRYGPAMGEYENASERIRWEFHLLNQGLPVEIYEPGYLSEWYRKTNSPLGSYRQGMKAFRFYQDSDDRPDSAGFISAGAFFSDGPTNISDAVKEQSAQKIAHTLALGGYLHLAHYRAVNGEKERSDVWFEVIKNRLAERGRKLVLVARGHEDESVPLAHNWEIFRVEPVSGETAARLADVWS
ncbi:MAG: hypothetical protein KC649_07135, partial [Candidatus Omnitrophica bacterium]|nr:hypothetical protein [Candidatus Omnitrophota bacterium]